MDSQLLVRVLNHHGQQLTHAIENFQGTDSITPSVRREINYHQYHSRAKDFKFEDRIKRQKLYEFIAKKANLLFQPLSSSEFPHPVKHDNGLWANMPPLENHMYVPLVDRKKYFFETLKLGDLLIGKLQSFNIKGANVAVLTTDGGKKRYINDLSIKAFCPMHNFPQSVAGMEKINEYVRGVVVKVDATLEKISISMRMDHFNVKLGLISEDELPQFYKTMMANLGETYPSLLTKLRPFRNPFSDSALSTTLGLPQWKVSTFASCFNNFQYPDEEYAQPIRKSQNKIWAYRSVKEGVSYFKQGKQTEALQCLNQALQIDTENVEAFVARGALLANNSSFKKAIEDFEKALTINPHHANGKKYLTETLVALGKSLQEKGSMEEAYSVYKSALCSNPDSYDAKLALKELDALMTKKLQQEKQALSSHAKGKRPMKEDGYRTSGRDRQTKRRPRDSSSCSSHSSPDRRKSASPRIKKEPSTRDLYKTRQKLKDLLKKEKEVSLNKKKKKSASPEKNQRDDSYEKELEAELVGKVQPPITSPNSLKEMLHKFYQKSKYKGISPGCSPPSSLEGDSSKEIPLLKEVKEEAAAADTQAKFSFKMKDKQAATKIKKKPFSSSESASDKEDKATKAKKSSPSSCSSSSSSSSSSSRRSRRSRKKRRRYSYTPPSPEHPKYRRTNHHVQDRPSQRERYASDSYHHHRQAPPPSKRRHPPTRYQRGKAHYTPTPSKYAPHPPAHKPNLNHQPFSMPFNLKKKENNARSTSQAAQSRPHKTSVCPPPPLPKTVKTEVIKPSGQDEVPNKEKLTLQEMESFLEHLRKKNSKGAETSDS